MVEPTWKRIAGVHVDDDGTVGAVWVAADPVTKITHVYDAAVFRNEVPVVIHDAIAARGRHYPVAWAKKQKSFADKLLDAGVRVLPEPCEDDPMTRELLAKQIWQLMRGKLFFVDRRVGEWMREYKEYFREGGKVPEIGFPLMAATRHAIEKIEYARAEREISTRPKQNYPKLAIV